MSQFPLVIQLMKPRNNFSGKVFNIEKRELKSKTIMITFGLTDYTGSIAVKVFLSGEQK